jgi:hypothetical protein
MGIWEEEQEKIKKMLNSFLFLVLKGKSERFWNL